MEEAGCPYQLGFYFCRLPGMAGCVVGKTNTLALVEPLEGAGGSLQIYSLNTSFYSGALVISLFTMELAWSNLIYGTSISYRFFLSNLASSGFLSIVNSSNSTNGYGCVDFSLDL
jgi:hypothetical protein